MSAHWGKLACDILTGKWDVALEELNTLREAIDSRTPTIPPSFSAPSSSSSNSADPALMQLQSRTWLLHWSLFVYFNHPQGRTLLLETFLSPTYLNTIQTSCPWILRYLATAAILSRKSSSSSAAAQPGDRPLLPIKVHVRPATLRRCIPAMPRLLARLAVVSNASRGQGTQQGEAQQR